MPSRPPSPHHPRQERFDLFVSTGSSSSDLLLAPVLAELRRRGRLGEVAGAGGDVLRDEQVRLFVNTDSLSCVGVIAGLRSLLFQAGPLLSAWRRVKQHLRDRRPDLVVLADNPGINLPLLRLAHRQGIPVLYYVAPELWGLWSWEVRALVARAAVVVPLFRSEAEVYRRHGANVCWLGHPLVDLVGVSRSAGDRDRPPTIGLFPGSRRLEVRELLPVLQRAAALLHVWEPQARFVVCAANEVVARQIREHLPRWSVPVEFTERQSHAVLSRCDLLLTCSGTATLEAAVVGVPMVVMYRMTHWLDRVITFYKLYRGGFPPVALPNYLTGQAIVPELILDDVTPERVAEEGLALLRDPARREAMARGFSAVRELLGPPGALTRVADLVEEWADRATPVARGGGARRRVPARHG
jgi:lipid-A-disaccharide synthase